MVNDITWSTLSDRHLHRIQHGLGPQVVGHRPADDLAAPCVQHHGQIQEARCRRHIGNVSDPKLVRPRRSEVAVNQVWRWPGVLVAPRGRWAAMAMAGPNQSGLPHQPRDWLAAMPLALGPQISMHPRCPIGLTRRRVHGSDPFQQRLVGDGMGRGWAANPGMVARLGHAEHARHGGDRKAGLVRAHEPEEPDGTAPVSRANQAAAFERMSRSSRSCLFSRRSRANSSRSAALRPGNASSRRPACLSAAATQAPIDCAVGSNSRARCVFR